ncbi:MAG: SPOR domain-containing protein [Halothiobacillaceae bacterium]
MIDEEKRQKQAELVAQLVKYGDRLTLLRGGDARARDEFLQRVEQKLPDSTPVLRLRASGTLDAARVRRTVADKLQLSPGIDTPEQLGQAIAAALTGQQRVLLVLEDVHQWAAPELERWLTDWRTIERIAPRRLRLAISANAEALRQVEAHPALREAQIATHLVELGEPDHGEHLVAERDAGAVRPAQHGPRYSLAIWYGGAAAFVALLVGLGFFLLGPGEREQSGEPVAQAPTDSLPTRPRTEGASDYPWRNDDFKAPRDEDAEAPQSGQTTPEPMTERPEPAAAQTDDSQPSVPAESPSDTEPQPEVPQRDEPAEPAPEPTPEPVREDPSQVPEASAPTAEEPPAPDPPQTEAPEPAEPQADEPETAETDKPEPAAPPAPESAAGTAQGDPPEQKTPSEPAKQPEREQAESAPRTVAGDEQWFRDTPRTRAVVQLAAVGDEAGIGRFIKRHDLKRDQIRVFRQQSSGKTLYTITWGDFPSLAQARRGIEDLPAELRESKPWARSVNAIRQLLVD